MADLAQVWQVQEAGGQVTPGDDLAIAVPSGQVVTLQAHTRTQPLAQMPSQQQKLQMRM